MAITVTLVLSMAVLFAGILGSPTNESLNKSNGGLLLKNVHDLKSSNGNDFDDVITVLQWNILYDKYDIGLDSWVHRKKHVCNYIKEIKPEIIGLQEVMESQLNYLKSCLPEYVMVGEARDEIKNPLYNPIFIRKSTNLRVTRSGTFWLSFTPDQPGSKAPTSKEPRICTWAEIMIKTNDDKWQPVVMATTHLAYRSMETARTQIAILMSYLKEHVLKENVANQPIIVTGDFNWGHNSTVYNTMKDFGMHDTMADAKWIFPELTALPPYPGLIDYVWQTEFKSVMSATLMDRRPDNGRMLSDHRPVLAALKLLG